jgi:hypothetical protein
MILDFCRIKACGEVNSDTLKTAHKEMGHIHYFLSYKNLPMVFREAANPGIPWSHVLSTFAGSTCFTLTESMKLGLHEVIGDIVDLALLTTKHLRNAGLVPKCSQDSLEGEGKTSSASQCSDSTKRGDFIVEIQRPFGVSKRRRRRRIKHDEETSDCGPSKAQMEDLNYLMEMAARKLAFLPFAYVVDRWRW